MRERGILFSAEMVRAILAGTKTQTRRVVKGRGAIAQKVRESGHVTRDVIGTRPNAIWWFWPMGRNDGEPVPCPYGVVGDRLWVRETWAPCTSDGPVDDVESADAAMYRADGAALLYTGTEDSRPWHRRLDPYCWQPKKWRPSIFMPRWASRITLEITDVRVQRLQDISEEDARAEGAPGELHRLDAVRLGAVATHRAGLERVWREINGDGSWDANPWVWALTFKRVTP